MAPHKMRYNPIITVKKISHTEPGLELKSKPSDQQTNIIPLYQLSKPIIPSIAPPGPLNK